MNIVIELPYGASDWARCAATFCAELMRQGLTFNAVAKSNVMEITITGTR